MNLNHFRTFSLLLSQIFFISASSLNISTYFISSNTFNTEPPPPPSPLKDVLKAIALKQSWDLDDVRVSRVRNAKTGTSQKYEFRIPMEKNDLLFKFSDEVKSWKRLRRLGSSRKAVLSRFRLDGPFELVVDGDDELKLNLPLNITHSGLKRLIVGEGITVFVEGAREISLYHFSGTGLPINRSSLYWQFRQPSCMLLFRVHIFGSVSLLAFKTHVPKAHIKTAFLGRDMIELLPDKCYIGSSYNRHVFPINALDKRLNLLEEVMRSLPGKRLLQKRISGFLKANITTSTLVQFELELERDIHANDRFWGTLAEWRTRPIAERVQFDVVARLEGKRLMPLVVKKVRPFVAADSTSWSSLMSNVSFTKFPSFLGPPEALTLDVKW